jgi:type III pantothenate kinase
MHNFTSQLPLIQLNPLDAEKDFPVIGDSTKGSLISGSIMAAIMEAEGIIAYYREQFGNLKVMLTGGDASYFATRLKNEIFAVPNLTLNGLQTILHYNINSI